MVEKTQNTSFGNTEENTNDEPVEQLNPEQKAMLDGHLMRIDPAYAVQFENEFRRDIEEFGYFRVETFIPYVSFMVFGGLEDPDARKVPVYDKDGKETNRFKSFTSYFEDFPITGILASPKSEQEIIEFQRYLEAKGIVPDGYFNSSLGKYSNDLVTVVFDIMDYADANLNIFENSPEYRALEADNDVRFFMSQEDEPQYVMQRKIFNKALDAYAEQTSFLQREEKKQTREAIEGDLFEQALQEYPSDDEFKTILEDALEGTGIKVTPKMFDKAATAFGKAYSTEMMENADLIENFKSSDIYADYLEGTNIKRKDVPMGGYMPTERKLNTDFFKEGITAEGFAEDYVEEEYGKQMSAADLGRKKIEVQQAVLSEVFKYISP